MAETFIQNAHSGNLVLKMEDLVTGDQWILETKDPISEVEIDTEPQYAPQHSFLDEPRILSHLLTIKATLPTTPTGVAYTMTTKKKEDNLNSYDNGSDRPLTPFVDRVPGYYQIEMRRMNVEEVAQFLKATSWKVDLKVDDPTFGRKFTFYGVPEKKGKKFVVHEGEVVVVNDNFAESRDPRVFTWGDFNRKFDQKANPRG